MSMKRANIVFPCFILEIFAGEKFLDLLSRTSRQIDDQRGGTLKDLELPDFLKVDKSTEAAKPSNDVTQSRPSEITPRPRMRKNIISDSHLMKKLANGPTISKTLPVSRSHERLHAGYNPDLDKSIQSVQSFGTPMSQSLQYKDVSFSQDGVMPSHGDAESYFCNALTQSAVDFDDSKLMDKSLQDLGFNSGSTAKISFGTFKGQPFQSDTPNKGGKSEPRPVPKPRQSRPAVPKRRNPPTQNADVNNKTRVGSTQSSSDLDITLLPPSSDSSDSELLLSMTRGTRDSDMSPPTPIQRNAKSLGASQLVVNYGSQQVQSTHKQYSQSKYSEANHKDSFNSLPHSTTVQPIVAESDIEYELTELLNNQRTFEQGSVTESSTPSPTTHDLVLDSESSVESDATPKRTSIMKKKQDSSAQNPHNSGQKAKKTLIFDTSEARGDMQVSFV